MPVRALTADREARRRARTRHARKFAVDRRRPVRARGDDPGGPALLFDQGRHVTLFADSVVPDGEAGSGTCAGHRAQGPVGDAGVRVRHDRPRGRVPTLDQSHAVRRRTYREATCGRRARDPAQVTGAGRGVGRPCGAVPPFDQRQRPRRSPQRSSSTRAGTSRRPGRALAGLGAATTDQVDPDHWSMNVGCVVLDSSPPTAKHEVDDAHATPQSTGVTAPLGTAARADCPDRSVPLLERASRSRSRC